MIKKITINKLIFIALSGLILMVQSSCSTVSNYVLTDPKLQPVSPVPVGQVRIIANEDQLSGYRKIADVHVHNRCNFWLVVFAPSDDSMIELLKQEAADLGADAIIHVKKSGMGQFEWFEKHFQACAVKLVNEKDCNNNKRSKLMP